VSHQFENRRPGDLAQCPTCEPKNICQYHLTPTALIQKYLESDQEDRQMATAIVFFFIVVAFVMHIDRQGKLGEAEHRKPPMRAEFLLALIVPRAFRDAILGDMAEEFGRNYDRFGDRKACMLYWRDFVATAMQRLGCALKKFLGLTEVAEKLRRFL
jgi:hypothetical protein